MDGEPFLSPLDPEPASPPPAAIEDPQRPPLLANPSSGWLPAADDDAPTSTTARTGSILKHNAQSPPASAQGDVPSSNSIRRQGRATSSLGYAESISRRSTFTNAEGRTVTGSAFINGASTTGPNAVAEPDESLHLRGVSADSALTPKQKSKIHKQEARDGKRLSKIIKQEAKMEKQSLAVAMQDLSSLLIIQKAASKREAKAQSLHAKALTAFQKQEADFLEAQSKYEIARARLTAEETTLESTRDGSRDAMDRAREKSQEIDALRQMLGVDERERQVKLVELAGKKSRHSFW